MSLRSSFSGHRPPPRRPLSDDQKWRFLKAANPQKYAALQLLRDRAIAEELQPYSVNIKRDEVS